MDEATKNKKDHIYLSLMGGELWEEPEKGHLCKTCGGIGVVKGGGDCPTCTPPLVVRLREEAANQDRYPHDSAQMRANKLLLLAAAEIEQLQAENYSFREWAVDNAIACRDCGVTAETSVRKPLMRCNDCTAKAKAAK